MAKKISETTLAVLSRVTIDGNNIFLTCGQLDRKQYVAVDDVLKAMGGKWNRKTKGHVFQEDPTDKFEQIMLTGEIIPPKKYGYFPTPSEIAKRLVEMADIQPGMTVLEPSAGQGGIADEIPKDCKLDCIELLPENAEILEKKGYRVLRGDFFLVEAKPLYDRVIMNPPFHTEGRPQADIDHVNHAWECVLPGGRLSSIMSSGVVFRENRKSIEFRAMVESHNGFFEKLPEGSFKESGTGVNAVVVVMDKGR